MFEGKSICVFDCEIKKTLVTKEDWNDHASMGLSCMVVFDYKEMRYRVFDDHNAQEGMRLLYNSEWCAGFNTIGFDWKLLCSTYPNFVPSYSGQSGPTNFDIRAEVCKVVGTYTKGYKLGEIAQETLGYTKSDEGGHAPQLYQEGRIAELIDYCIQDVKVEKDLFEFVVKNGYIRRFGKEVKLFVPPELKAMI